MNDHDLWAVVQSAKNYPSMDNNFSNKSTPFGSPNFLVPSISQRIEISDEFLLVPLESICRVAFVIPEYQRVFNEYADLDTYIHTCQTKTAAVIEPWDEWEKKFICPDEE